MLGSERELYPMEMLGQAGLGFPPLFIYHGTEDGAVEVAQTEAFVRRLGEVGGGGKALVKYESGDHGFDAKVGVGEPWLREGLEFVKGEWLRGGVGEV